MIESQTLRLKPYQTVTIRNKNVSHIAATDDMLSSVTKVTHIKKEEVRGCINHKHIYIYMIVVINVGQHSVLIFDFTFHRIANM